MSKMSERNVPAAETIANGDELRNINSYDYLAHIAEHINEDLKKAFPAFRKVAELCGPQSTYNGKYPYGNLYTEFLLAFEDNISEVMDKRKEYANRIVQLNAKISVQTEALKRQSEGPRVESLQNFNRRVIAQTASDVSALTAQQQAIDKMITAVYSNPNEALERSAIMVKEVINTVSHTSPEIETAVRRRMMGNSTSRWNQIFERINYYFPLLNRNKITPQEAGSRLGRLKALLSQTFKPHTTTSIPSVRRYNYQVELPNASEEQRSGTAAQMHNGEARVSPAFESWLDVEKRTHAADNETITHVYFNLLGRDREDYDYEGKKEKRLTQELHKLEERHSNILVITLPADKGLMDKKLLQRHKKTIPYETAWDRMFNIAKGKSSEPIQDFYMSQRAKQKLYGKGATRNSQNEIVEAEKLQELLEKSFKAQGFKKGDFLSEANMQAVYFHFTKYEIPNFVLEKTGAKNHRFPCKDGIDRGGVASAYYNLMKSLETNTPLDRDEFDRALHAAPTLVKGRGMNHHTQLIWNAVDNYIRARSPEEKAALPKWLMEWRNDNAPERSRKHYIHQLDKHIHTNQPEEKKRSSIYGRLFGRGTDVSVEVAAAKKLKQMVRNVKYDPFTPDEKNALSKGPLAKIRKGLEHDGFILNDLKGTYESLHKEKRAERIEENTKSADEAPIASTRTIKV